MPAASFVYTRYDSAIVVVGGGGGGARARALLDDPIIDAIRDDDVDPGLKIGCAEELVDVGLIIGGAEELVDVGLITDAESGGVVGRLISVSVAVGDI